MNFTREPIIETVISPKEGSKLVVRNSKGGKQEEYFVDAIEIVSFGTAVFYRSTERPKSFLVPASDYEVIELKETKMVLKSNSLEKSIKIGGGKTETENKMPKRKKGLKKSKNSSEIEAKKEKVEQSKGGDANDETQVSSSILRKLFPPPPNLIKEKFNHIKSPEKIDESISEEIVKEERPKNQNSESVDQVKKEEATAKEIIKKTTETEEENKKESPKEDFDKKKEE